MTSMTILGGVLWARQVDDRAIRDRIVAMRPDTFLRLIVDGSPIWFRKVRDGRDGRPTQALRVGRDDVAGQASWTALRHRRGATVPVSIDDTIPADPYLAYLDELLWEWNTPEDAAAFDGL